MEIGSSRETAYQHLTEDSENRCSWYQVGLVLEEVSSRECLDAPWPEIQILQNRKQIVRELADFSGQVAHGIEDL